MHAGRRSIKLEGQQIAKTPRLVPSFSSKGFSGEVGGLVQLMGEFISDTSLVSAYDLHYKEMNAPDCMFADLVILDSGGYEAAQDHELSEIRKLEADEYKPKEWTAEMHSAVVQDWLEQSSGTFTALVSYDHPNQRMPLQEQIAAANKFFEGKRVVRELLIKPETERQIKLQIDNIIAEIPQIAGFDIVGVTEKELGKTPLERMKNIALIRRALDEHDPEIPIHVFGSLDTVMTPLYFISGADVFDGLTWLRYAFHEGNTVYFQQSHALNGRLKRGENDNTLTLVDNFNYIEKLQVEFCQFANSDGDFEVFKHHRDVLIEASNMLLGELEK